MSIPPIGNEHRVHRTGRGLGNRRVSQDRLVDVHGKFLTHARYANGVTMDISGDFPNGIKWYGTKGWIFVTRDEMTTLTAGAGQATKIEPLMASDPKVLDSVIGPDEIHLETSSEHHANWLDCVRSRKQPLTPIEIGHRACSTCLLHHIAMKTGRHLHWDPERSGSKTMRRQPRCSLVLSVRPIHLNRAVGHNRPSRRGLQISTRPPDQSSLGQPCCGHHVWRGKEQHQHDE